MKTVALDHVLAALILSMFSLVSCAEASEAEKAGFQLTPQMRAAMSAPGPETPLAWLGNAIKYHYQTDPMSIQVGQKYRLPEARKKCAGGDADSCATASSIEKWLAWAKPGSGRGGTCDRDPCNRVPVEFVPPALKGKPWVLHAWASWCPYCRMDHQWFMDTKAARKSSRLVSVLYQDSESAANGFLSSQGDPYGGGSIRVSRELLNSLDLRAVPATYLIDQNGNVVRRFQGNLNASGQEALKKYLK